MAYNNRRGYNSYNRSYGSRSYGRRGRSNKKIINRIIIIAAGLIAFGLIIALITLLVNCVCASSNRVDPTINTATVGTGKKVVVKAKKKATDNIQFKEPNIKDDDSDSTGTFDGDYYIWNTKAFTGFHGNKQNAKDYAGFINDAKEKLGLATNVYSSLIPTHIEMGLPNRLKNTDEGITTTSQADYTKAVYKRFSKKVKYINSYNELSDHCNDYIYFDSDTNPTGLGGYYIYKSFCDVMKKSPISLNDCQESKIEEFYGSYNNFTDTELAVDAVQYWDFPYNVNNTITTEDDDTNSYDSCYNKEAESGAWSYNVFLYGRNPLEVIKSESDKASGKIAIVHNNTGNSTVPYFTYNYQEVYSIDYNTYSGDLKEFCSKNDIKDVLFLVDTESSSDSDQMANLKKLIS
ncbi:MAG: hypothetical protein IJ903_02240 [Ruminococcus sp.]|nr:hypothetical protein [Ruminococcus sp.]